MAALWKVLLFSTEREKSLLFSHLALIVEVENKREERERRPNEIQIQKQKMSIFDENVLYGSRDLVLRTTYWLTDENFAYLSICVCVQYRRRRDVRTTFQPSFGAPKAVRPNTDGKRWNRHSFLSISRNHTRDQGCKTLLPCHWALYLVGTTKYWLSIEIFSTKSYLFAIELFSTCYWFIFELFSTTSYWFTIELFELLICHWALLLLIYYWVLWVTDLPLSFLVQQVTDLALSSLESTMSSWFTIELFELLICHWAL